jgi:hypothetical protein
MQRNQITAGLIVRVRPSNSRYSNEWSWNIGRITTSATTQRSVGYYGKSATLVEVEWYATINNEGTTRTWEAPRTERHDARKLEVIDPVKLAAEKASWHEVTEAGRREKEANEARTEANVEAIRTALGDERWGDVRHEGRMVQISDKQLAALVALVSKVVAS